ncbi:YqjD family protein [Brucellaceae bacterium C25G]
MARAADKVTQKIEELTDVSSSELQEQIAQLKQDISAIAATISQLGQQKIRDAKRDVSQAYGEAIENSGTTINELKSCAQSIEDQLLETVRERPIASLATAVGVGYLLAILRR